MSRTIILSLVFLVGPLALFSQSAEDEVIRLKQSLEVGDVQVGSEGDLQVDPEGDEQAALKKESKSGSWNMSVGTSFSYMKGYGSGMGFYAAPTYTLPLSNRWSVHGGLVASHFTGFNTPGTGELQNPGTTSSLAIFAAASYRMNERLVLHGAGVKQLVTAYPSLYAPYPMDNLSLGATYKLGNNVSIGASISINQGRGYYNGSPFYGSPFTTPFSPYTSPLRW